MRQVLVPEFLVLGAGLDLAENGVVIDLVVGVNLGGDGGVLVEGKGGDGEDG